MGNHDRREQNPESIIILPVLSNQRRRRASTRSFYLPRHVMRTGGQLPLEVLEHVIDCLGAGNDFGLYPSTYCRTLRACSLTCSAWLPRSRRHLYRRVLFHNSDYIPMFSRTVCQQPHLGALVEAVWVDGRVGTQYLPFAQGSILAHLPNVRYLSLLCINFLRRFPPFYPLLIGGLPLRELVLDTCMLPLGQLFRLLWSLPELHTLQLKYEGSTGLPSFHPGHEAADLESLDSMQALRPRSCKNLRVLAIDVGCSYSRSLCYLTILADSLVCSRAILRDSQSSLLALRSARPSSIFLSRGLGTGLSSITHLVSMVCSLVFHR